MNTSYLGKLGIQDTVLSKDETFVTGISIRVHNSTMETHQQPSISEKNGRKIKLAVAEDHRPFRHKIVEMLNRECDFEVVFQSDNGKTLIENFESTNPDIVIMDIRMPIMDGIEATQIILKAFPQKKVIILSHYDNDNSVVEMIIHGVKSFIGKNDDPNELFKAIRIVHSGGFYISERFNLIIQKYLSSKYNKLTNYSESAEISFINKLSDFELEILRQVACFKSVKDIAKTLSVSPNTINNRQSRLRKKLSISGKRKLLEYVLSIKQYLNQFSGWKDKK
ncbi:MAG: response regulator [Chryseotalea sp.]|jgi:DNA-binding NarL/FixJ family response regulator